MLEKLGEVIKKATNRIANAIFLDKNLLDSIIKDIQRAMIEADVNIKLVKELSDKVRKTALDERIKGIEKKEHVIKILHDELLKILGEQKELKLKKEQNRILLLGLYGAGKTTTAAKMGNYYAKRGNKVALVGLDVHRPAASEQLKQLAEKNNLRFFIDLKEKDPMKIWKKNQEELEKYDVVIIDTAGRHTLDEELIRELISLKRVISPTELILVMPADIGQAAKQQASDFKKAVNISGIIITRMDSTAKGGGALTACNEIHSGVYFITTGEKINDLEEFNPKTFLSRILGMGDLDTLIEKIKSVTDKDNQKNLQKKLESGKINIDDFVEQIKSMNSMGGFSKLKDFIPGFSGVKGKISDDVLEMQQAKTTKWEHIVKSMTKEEKENPEILERQTSRIGRIARGAGVNNSDVRALLKQYKLLTEMVKGGMSSEMESGQLNQKQMMKLAKKFGKVKHMKF